jgi:hypothetical protein
VTRLGIISLKKMWEEKSEEYEAREIINLMREERFLLVQELETALERIAFLEREGRDRDHHMQSILMLAQDSVEHELIDFLPPSSARKERMRDVESQRDALLIAKEKAEMHIAHLKQELEAVKRISVQKDQQLEDAARAIAERNTKVAELWHLNSQRESEKQNLQQELSIANEQLEKLDTDREKKESLVSALREQLEGLYISNQALSFQDFPANMPEATKTDLNLDLVCKEQRVRISLLEGTVKALEERLDFLAEENTNLEMRAEKAEAAETTLLAHKERTESELSSLRERATNFETKLYQNVQMIADLEKYRSEWAKLKPDNDLLESQVTALRALVEEKEEQIKKMNDQIVQAHSFRGNTIPLHILQVLMAWVEDLEKLGKSGQLDLNPWLKLQDPLRKLKSILDPFEAEESLYFLERHRETLSGSTHRYGVPPLSLPTPATIPPLQVKSRNQVANLGSSESTFRQAIKFHPEDLESPREGGDGAGYKEKFYRLRQHYLTLSLDHHTLERDMQAMVLKTSLRTYRPGEQNESEEVRELLARVEELSAELEKVKLRQKEEKAGASRVNRGLSGPENLIKGGPRRVGLVSRSVGGLAQDSEKEGEESARTMNEESEECECCGGCDGCEECQKENDEQEAFVLLLNKKELEVRALKEEVSDKAEMLQQMLLESVQKQKHVHDLQVEVLKLRKELANTKSKLLLQGNDHQDVMRRSIQSRSNSPTPSVLKELSVGNTGHRKQNVHSHLQTLSIDHPSTSQHKENHHSSNLHQSSLLTASTVSPVDNGGKIDGVMAALQGKIMEGINRQFHLTQKEAISVHRDLVLRFIDANKLLESLKSLLCIPQKNNYKPAEKIPAKSVSKEKVKNSVSKERADNLETFLSSIQTMSEGINTAVQRAQGLEEEYRKIDENTRVLIRYLEGKALPVVLSRYKLFLSSSKITEISTKILEIRDEQNSINVNTKKNFDSCQSRLKGEVNRIKNMARERRDILNGMIVQDRINVDYMRRSQSPKK